MLTAHDLDSLGKQLSQDYIDQKVDLTENLAKVATAKGLNQHQTYRVAESANVESYLALMKTAEDKYIDFPLADAKKAYITSQGLEKEASAEPSLDYIKPYTDVPVTEVFNKFASLEGIERSEDQETPKSESEWRKEAADCEGTLKFLDDALLETNSSLEKDYLELKYQVKQAMLQDVTFQDLANIIKVAADPMGETLCEELEKDLKDDLNHYSFQKEAQFSTPPNPESKIFKVALATVRDAGRHFQIQEALDHYDKKYSEILESSKLPRLYKQASKAKSAKEGASAMWRLIKAPFKHWKATGILAGGGVAYGAGKTKGKQQQGAVLQLAATKLGPTKDSRKIFR